MPKVRWVMSLGFIANFIRFPAVQKIENRLRFDNVTESLQVGNFFETQRNIQKTKPNETEAWFKCLLYHPTRKLIGPILQLLRPTSG